MIALIKKLWEIAWDQWEDSNVILHNEWEAKDLQDLASIQDKVKKGIQNGYRRYSPMQALLFQKYYKEHLDKSPLYQRS